MSLHGQILFPWTNLFLIAFSKSQLSSLPVSQCNQDCSLLIHTSKGWSKRTYLTMKWGLDFYKNEGKCFHSYRSHFYPASSYSSCHVFLYFSGINAYLLIGKISGSEPVFFLEVWLEDSARLMREHISPRRKLEKLQAVVSRC